MRGKILCYGAIIRSGEANAEQLGTISEKLVSLSSKRSYLATPAHKIIIEGFDQVNKSVSKLFFGWFDKGIFVIIKSFIINLQSREE